MPHLEIVDGPDKGKVFDIPDFDSVIVGRAKTADLVIADKSVSRKHAELTDQGMQFAVRDLGSANGTWIDGERIEHEALGDGMVIGFGTVRARFLESQPYRVSGPGGSAVVMVADSDRPGFNVDAEAPAEGQSMSYAPQALPGDAPQDDSRARLDRLIALGEKVNDAADMEQLSDAATEGMLGLFPQAERALLLLKGRRTGRFVPLAVRHREENESASLMVSRSVLREVVGRRKGLLLSDVGSDERFADAESLKKMSATSMVCVPLVRRDTVLGVLQIDTSAAETPFDEPDLRMLVSVAGPVGLAVQNLWAIQDRDQVFLGNILSLVRAMEAKDEYTRGHSDRVAEYAVGMARLWNKTVRPSERIDLKRLRFAGYLHDIGKIAIQDDVLKKAGRLTDEEFAHIRTHAQHTAYILQGMYLSDELAGLDRVASLHHERCDGSGYPQGLSGGDIPVESAMLAVADTYDAMTSNRPYREALSAEAAIAEIRKVAGTQLVAELAEIFLTLYDEGGVEEVQRHQRDSSQEDLMPKPATASRKGTDTAPSLAVGKKGEPSGKDEDE